MPAEIETESKRQKWQRILVHEFYEYLFNLVFLAFFLVAFAWYRRQLLASYGIQYTAFWAPLISAAVLAKVIMIGDALRMGRGLRKWPLAVPTIYRTVVFSFLVVGFSVVEHVVGALLHGKKAADGIANLTNTGWHGLLAWYVLIIVAFLPFFTVKEIEAAFGQSKVRGLFFRKSRDKSNVPEDPHDPPASSKP